MFFSNRPDRLRGSGYVRAIPRSAAAQSLRVFHLPRKLKALSAAQLNHRGDLIPRGWPRLSCKSAEMGPECRQGLRRDGEGEGGLGGRDPCSVLRASNSNRAWLARAGGRRQDNGIPSGRIALGRGLPKFFLGALRGIK